MTLSQLLDLNPDYKANPNMVSIGAEIMLSTEDSSSDESGGAKKKADYTDDADTRFFGIPGEPEMWKKGDTWYSVYMIPGTDPPVPLLYEVTSAEDLKSFFGDTTPVADRTVTDDVIQKSGGVVFGTTDNIPAEDGDPWAGFLARMDRAAETQPWLADPDVFSVYAGSWMEGREVEQWELEGTNWWQTQNKDQRDWAWTMIRDPEEAARRMEERDLAITNTFLGLGMEVSPDLVSYIAKEIETGNWSEVYGSSQIGALAGGGDSAYELDAGMQKYMKGEDMEVPGSAYKTQDVIDMYSRWLGPVFGQINDGEARRWATKIREGGKAAEEELLRSLQQQRMAVLPEYTDPSMSYAEIAQPWLNYGTQIWGQTMDETSDMFISMLRANDASEAGKLLRSEGLKQNIGQVEQNLTESALGREGNLRRAV